MGNKQDVLDKLRASIAAMEASNSISLDITEPKAPAHNQEVASFSGISQNEVPGSWEDTTSSAPVSTKINGTQKAQPSQPTSRSPRNTHEDAEGVLSEEEALQKILRLVNHREHSTASLRKRLRQASFEDRIIENALVRAQELGLVDDIRFGNILVRSRIGQKKGCQGIERELIQEGIDPETIEAFLEYRDEVAPESEVTQAVALLEKHPPKAKNLRESAYRKLRQKGYDNSTAHEAIRLWLDGQSLQ